VDVIVVYKVDRLSRSLADFIRMIDLFDQHQVSFVSVTQQFNTSSSMGRLTLNVLLSFAQFEREVTSERIRDKIAASKQKGMWMGGRVPLGYDIIDKNLVVNEAEAERVRHIYIRYVALGCVRKLKEELDAEGYISKDRELNGSQAGGRPFSRGALYALLKNPLFIGKVTHQGTLYEGQHAAILDTVLWQAAQDLLVENKNHHDIKTSVKDPSLLAGLLFDDNGNPMSPSHTKKHNRRYRYYINQAVLQYREKEAGTILRIPAKTIEDLVIQRLKRLWQSPNELLSTLVECDLTITQQSAIQVNPGSLGEKKTENGTLVETPAKNSTALFFGIEDPNRISNEWTETSFYLETRELVEHLEQGKSVDDKMPLIKGLKIKLSSITMNDEEYIKYQELIDKIPLDEKEQQELMRLERKLFPKEKDMK